MRMDALKVLIEDISKREDHAELIEGKLVVTDKTSVSHNNAVLEMTSAFKRFIKEKDGKCRVFSENVVLYCDELCENNGNYFLPDVMVVCSEDGVKEDGIHAAPSFVAEVTSEATRKIDFGKKMVIYGEIGVSEYWVVDMQRNVIVRYLSDNDFAPEIISYPNTLEIYTHIYPDLAINLSDIFG